MYSNFEITPNSESTPNYLSFFEDKIKEFGGVYRGNKKYVFRKNVGSNSGTSFPDKGAYFGCINEGEEPSGVYSDLSIVVFPSNEDKAKDDRWIIALGVGSLGYKNDYALASLPGTRRLFANHLERDVNNFIKNDFLDIESHDGFTTFCNKVNKENKDNKDNEANEDNEANKDIIPTTLKKAINGSVDYRRLLLAFTLFNPNDKDAAENLITKYLAIYAKLRDWISKDKMEKAIKTPSKTAPENVDELDETNVKVLLEKRKYVVLQGAPGTGKTRLAKRIASDTEKENVFFTQFHAETTYSDFIYGIIPDVKGDTLKYTDRKGKFVEAIQKAQDNPNKKVYLIIDEINRANLSNVLGPAFYLFEPTMTGHNVEIEVCPGTKLEKLPDNLYVIATMNTADRSLAVVDFALRRRFAWYTLFPHELKSVDEGMHFCEKEFNAIADIFEQFASDEELNLQPGHAYFIVSADDQKNGIENRLRYEIMPLIKEYLLDGMLARAKDDFVNYFRERIHEEMFQ